MPASTALKELDLVTDLPNGQVAGTSLLEEVKPITPGKLFNSLAQFGSTYFPSSPNLDHKLAELAAKGGIKQDNLTLTSCISRDCRGQNTPLFLALLDETGFLSPEEQPSDNALEQFYSRNKSGTAKFFVDLKHLVITNQSNFY